MGNSCFTLFLANIVIFFWYILSTEMFVLVKSLRNTIQTIALQVPKLTFFTQVRLSHCLPSTIHVCEYRISSGRVHQDHSPLFLLTLIAGHE